MDSQLIEKLHHFGLTKNESKTYIALLKQYPATGYEISQRSGVPRSAIYDVLKKLELQGVISSNGSKPVTYRPIQPQQFTARLTSKFEHNIHDLKKMLSDLKKEKETENTWNLKGYKALVDQARSMVDAAKESIYCSVWDREYSAMREQLARAAERQVDIVCFSFCHISDPVGDTFSYNIQEAKLREIWHRQIVLIVDKKMVLLGSADKTPDNLSICTDNKAILNIALNYLTLDLTLLAQRKGLSLDGITAKLMIKQSEGLENLLNL